MRKTDKKIDNQLRISLTQVCDTALKEFSGFQWLTHIVNYDDFSQSLNIICVFDTNENLALFLSTKAQPSLTTLIQNTLKAVNIPIKNVNKHISYDTEENCRKEHKGKWGDRLNN